LAALVFTGKFAFGPRRVCEAAVEALGGRAGSSVTRVTNYLVIGTFGSRDWIHTSHGRKIEQAVNTGPPGSDSRLCRGDITASGNTRRMLEDDEDSLSRHTYGDADPVIGSQPDASDVGPSVPDHPGLPKAIESAEATPPARPREQDTVTRPHNESRSRSRPRDASEQDSRHVCAT
jgi:hypothetical protein